MKYRCPTCGYVYDEAAGFPQSGIQPGTKWGLMPTHWVCPKCGARTLSFVPMQSAYVAAQAINGMGIANVPIARVTYHDRI